MPDTVYRPSPIKRHRRTKAEIAEIEDAIFDIVRADHPMTLRGLFYRLVAAGVIAKDEREYKNVGRYLLKLRREDRVPYAWIADNTRWMRKPRTYYGLHDVLEHTVETYRRALWSDQDAYVEVWCEKDTLAGVLYAETEPYDVPLMVVRGFSSETYLHSAAEAIAVQDKPAYLYLLTDYDPSGLGIATDIERRIRGFIPDVEVHVERIAVTEDQIDRLLLPTRPTKRTDSRSKGFTRESVELEAIPPATLRALVRSAIEQHVDPDLLDRTIAVEEAERATLVEIERRFRDVA